MSTLHMQTEAVHSMARQMMQISARAHTELQSLMRAEKSLEAAWQSKSGDEFLVDATEVLRRLQMQYELLAMLAERVEREAAEWEQVDHKGAMAFRISTSDLYQAMTISIFSGGSGSTSTFTSTILPVFTGLSVGKLLGPLPGWLDTLLDRFFPPAEIASPFGEESDSSRQSPSTTFGDLLKEAPPGSTPPTEGSPSENNGYGIYYNIPSQSQGTLYGSAACLPTSLSMITAYFHAKDPANPSITPEGLRNMLDEGDGTEGVGITLNKLNDDLNELGYTNVKNFQSDMDGLRKELADGPVVANIGVRLVSQPNRALDGPGSTNHSVVIRGISDDGVLINDPWSGIEIKLTNEEFLSMWSRGDHWLQTVRP